MTLQNKITPAGEIVASPMRGMMMGNRGGKLHDPGTKTLHERRRWMSRQWICCLTSFKERHRTVMGESYTELFFLDEVTAFSAGHRPCFECRREAATSFARCWADAHQLDRPPRAAEMDMVLHHQRLDGRAKHYFFDQVANLPDGSMYAYAGEFFAVCKGKAQRWTFGGYKKSTRPPSVPVEVLTPPAIIAVLQAGYRPRWHFSS